MLGVANMVATLLHAWRRADKTVGELLADELTRDHEPDQMRWLHAGWTLLGDEDRIPPRAEVGKLLDQLEAIAGGLRAAAAGAPVEGSSAGKPGAPPRTALTNLRREMLAHAPRDWSGVHTARVIAAVLFASGLVPTFAPESERRTLSRLGQIAGGAKNP
jgi:hypothetical protein